MTLPTSNLVARYESADILQSGGLMTGWTDSSGLGNHVTSVPSAPTVRTIRGRNTLGFAGAQWFAVPSSVAINAQSLSVYTIIKGKPVSGMIFSAATAPSSGFAASLYYAGAGGTLYVFDGANKAGTMSPPNTSRHLVGMRLNSSNSRIILGAESETLTACSPETGTGARVGQWGAGGIYFTGDMEALWIYSAALSDSELSQLREYCLSNYATGTADQTAFIAYRGDSQTVGFGISSDDTHVRIMCEQWGLEPKTHVIATPGDRVDNHMIPSLSTFNALLTSQSSGYTRKIAILFGGTNDINQGGRTGAQVKADIDTWRSSVLGAGYTECWFIPPLPYTAGTYETERQSLISLVAADSNWDGRFIRSDLNTDIGVAGANLNSTYYQSDTLHMKATAHAILGQIVAEAINPTIATQSRRRRISQQMIGAI